MERSTRSVRFEVIEGFSANSVNRIGLCLVIVPKSLRYPFSGIPKTFDYPMPTYYFHIRDNGDLIKDPDGLELPDVDAVRAECKRIIASVLQEEQMDDQRSANREFQVEDEAGRTVFVVPFRSAVSRVRTARR